MGATRRRSTEDLVGIARRRIQNRYRLHSRRVAALSGTMPPLADSPAPRLAKLSEICFRSLVADSSLAGALATSRFVTQLADSLARSAAFRWCAPGAQDADWAGAELP